MALILASGCREPTGGNGPNARVVDYRLAEHPLISIGVAEGAEAYQLFRVRSAFQLHDGSVVVANSGTSELRYYDPDGQHVRTVGRRGWGPGEFDNLRYARALGGDTIVTWDVGQRRVSYFDRHGELVREFSVDLTGHVVQIGGISIPAQPVEMVAQSDGLLLFQAAAPMRMLSGMQADGTYDPSSSVGVGVHRVEFALFTVDASGSVVRRLGPVPAREWYLADGIWQIRFFGHWFYIAGGRTVFVAGSGKPYVYLATSGRDSLRLVEPGFPARAVPDDLWQRRLERAIPSNSTRERAARIRAMPKPEIMPAYSALLLDDEDRAWVQEFDPDAIFIPYTVGASPQAPPWAPGPQRWSIFNSDGIQVGRVEIPRNVRLTDIRDGRVTAVVHDELGVERVQVFSLVAAR